MNIYATELYHALQKAHPDIWQVKDYLGEENFEKVISPYLDENGDLDPNPLWAMLNPDITPAENLEKTWKRSGTRCLLLFWKNGTLP